MNRRRAILHVGASDLATLLRLPEDVKIVGYTVDFVRDSVVFRLESDRFEHVQDCAEPPALIASVHVEETADGTFTRRVTWDGLDGAGYETRHAPVTDSEGEELE